MRRLTKEDAVKIEKENKCPYCDGELQYITYGDTGYICGDCDFGISEEELSFI